ncbi:MAG TPA: hypothetical protein VIM70_12895 [Clostridium sp.]|uniref:hypothetical protein n=1 Tax=Clostridium sp. TaxID=1506 RepID=UPI002F92A49B
MKFKAIMLTLALGATLLVGCGSKAAAPATTTPAPAATTPAPAATTTPAPAATNPPVKADVVTTASIVGTEAAFQKAVSKDGSWIIATVQDLTISKEIVLEGAFKNEAKATARTIALYAQDAAGKKSASYTVTAPKLTVKSENTTIKGGTFKGDVYVDAKGFTIVDGKVEGNVTFATEALKSAFKLGAGGSITGTTAVVK